MISMVLLAGRGNLAAQDELEVLPASWIHFSNSPNSLYNYLSDQACDLLSKRAAGIAGISSLAGWQERQQQIREIMLEVIGPFPERTPLNARVVRTVEKSGFRVEHIVYESLPGYYVTSSLYVPTGLKRNRKAPAVIYCSGHAAEGYRSPAYQHVILNLVHKGFIVFAFDPVGQGERLQYFDPQTGKSKVGGPTREHSYPGTQVFVNGNSFARYMIWDGIRAVDYLLTRKEVDQNRIGITGRSGGGTQSAYIAAMDERIYAAAPECYLTNYTRLFQTVGPQDAEQNFFHGILRGIDHPDLLLVRAPKPALMITTTRDMFSIQGAMETENEVGRIYRAYGKEENFGRAEDDAAHESTQKNREALYAFFQKHLNNPGSSADEEVENLTAAELQVTETGQVSTSLGGETVYSLNSKETAQIVAADRSSEAGFPGDHARIRASAAELSGYREPAVVDDPVYTGRIRRVGYTVGKYYVQGEGEYVIPYLLMIPEKSNGRALIYLHPGGKSVEAAEGGEIEWFVRQGFTVLAPDLVGVGETGPGTYRGDAYLDGISHNLWYASLTIGRSIVGIRAGDVVRLTLLLKKYWPGAEIWSLARKEMAPVLVHAAAFSPAISRIALVEPFSSYRSIVMNRFYKSEYIHSTVPGALRAYDLPALAATLAPRKLMMAGITDGNGKKMDEDAVARELEMVKKSYADVHAEKQLMMIPGESGENPFGWYESWIR